MNEKEILQKIKEDAENLTPPASLQPEAIEKMLKDSAGSAGQENTRDKTVSAAFRKKRNRRIAQLGSIAAVFLLTLLAFSQLQRLQSRHEGEDLPADAAPEETAAGTIVSADTAPEESAAGTARAAGTTDDSPEPGIAAEDVSETDAPAESFTYASDYEEIYRALQEQFGQNSLLRGYGVSYNADAGDTAEAEMAVEEDGAADIAFYSTAQSSAGNAAGFSRTNLQEAEVDEGDIIKTDGEYLYLLRQDATLAVVRADGLHPSVVSVTALSGTGDTIHEMYLDGDMLNIITSRYVSSLSSDEDVYYTRYGRETVLQTYDISDRSAPVCTGTVTQEGSYEDSRKNGRYLYLFTCYSPTIAGTYAESTVIPRINKTQVPADRIYLPEQLSDSSFLVISSVDTAAPAEAADTKVLVSGASNYYVSPENIYIANEHYDNVSMDTVTELVKFHYASGKITGTAAGAVRGWLNNSFSMNEYRGMLRAVTTYRGGSLNAVRGSAGDPDGTVYEENWTEHNALYVLDGSLRTVGLIDGLAEGETIRSARFLGDTGYFVTFRQTDPLFSVDLSDPANPQVLGELKISGFSSYLHFYGEDLLLGIGYEADEETGAATGLKLSMFDISDPSGVRETDRFVIPGISWCPAIEEYKAILAAPEKNLIGFFCDDRYMVFSYDEENGFQSELIYDFYTDMLASQAEYNSMRGLYISDTLYLAGDSFVITFDMKNRFEKETVLALPDGTEQK